MALSVCFCSSIRFRDEIKDFIKELESISKSHGIYIRILEPDFEKRRSKKFFQSPEKIRLKSLTYRQRLKGVVMGHLWNKIAPNDTMFVFNKDGYVGTNTTGELFFAHALKKKIFALEDKFLTGEYPYKLHEEPCLLSLVTEIDIIKTPEELFKRLAGILPRKER